MTTNAEPTVRLQSLIDNRCPFCGDVVIDVEVVQVQVLPAAIHQSQRCEFCGEEWRVEYGPVGIVRGDDYLRATDREPKNLA